MTISNPATVTITAASALYLPAMAQQPLKAALDNINYLMQYHRPPLASVCWTVAPALARSAVFVFPVLPSVDGLLYTAIHRFTCSSATQTVTIDVDETANYTGAGTTWNNLTSDNATSSGTGGALSTHTQANFVIASTTEALRVTLTAPAAGTRTDHHCLIYPSPAAPTVGIATSGAVPFDDGMLAHADSAPIHTELVNRCKVTASAVLTSRKQNCLSFVQEETTYKYLWDTKGVNKYYPLPAGRMWLPNQGPEVNIDLLVLATVDAGSNVGMVRIRQIDAPGAKGVAFDADETIQVGTLAVTMQGQGLMTWADLEIGVQRTTGNESRLLAVMGYYTPGQ